MRKTFTTLVIILCILVISFLVIMGQSLRPYRAVRADAFSHAAEYVQLERPENFYWYNGEEGTILTAAGLDPEGNYLLAMITQDTGHIDLFSEEDVISEYEASQLFLEDQGDVEILDLTLGKEDDQFFWEITYLTEEGTMNYYYLSLLDGRWLKTIQNL